MCFVHNSFYINWGSELVTDWTHCQWWFSNITCRRYDTHSSSETIMAKMTFNRWVCSISISVKKIKDLLLLASRLLCHESDFASDTSQCLKYCTMQRKLGSGNSTRWLGPEWWHEHPCLGASICAQSFFIPIACKCKKFKQIFLLNIGFVCPYHIMVCPSLNLHSQNDKVPLVGSCHLLKFWGKKPKATTKVTQPSYQWTE